MSWSNWFRRKKKDSSGRLPMPFLLPDPDEQPPEPPLELPPALLKAKEAKEQQLREWEEARERDRRYAYLFETRVVPILKRLHREGILTHVCDTSYSLYGQGILVKKVWDRDQVRLQRHNTYREISMDEHSTQEELQKAILEALAELCF